MERLLEQLDRLDRDLDQEGCQDLSDAIKLLRDALDELREEER